ncbi:MAG: arginine--tRNA ligase [Pseudomonadota bacterium]
MNIFTEVGDKVISALDCLKVSGDLPGELEFTGIEIQEPRDPSHGDLASNAAMALAKRAGLKPRDLAEKIAVLLRKDEAIAKVDVAGPGFINITLCDAAWQSIIAVIVEQKETYGRALQDAQKRIQVEYVSANPTGPMHIGHCRGAVFGDTLSNLLSFVGHDVSREYYVNDAGAQVEKLGRTAYLRYLEALGDDIGEIPEGLYPGAYMKPIGQTLAERYGNKLREMDESKALTVARQTAIDMLLDEIRDDLDALNVKHDVFFSEQSLTTDSRDQVAEAIAKLREAGLIYEGQLPKPLGHDDEEWEERQQTLFKSTEFGDDIDRALMKSDGSYTYFANDVAYHNNKLERSFDEYLNVLGADHIGYIARLKAVMSALSSGDAKFETLITQLVKVMRDGQPVRMSKRAGTFVVLRDVVDEVGRDPVRFMMMMRKHDSPIDFDLAKVTEQSKDNPVFYVQYAHARTASIFRKAAEVFPHLKVGCEAIQKADLTQLNDSGERTLIRELSKFPRVIEGAARDREPHRIPFYLYDLASAFHQQHARGNDLPQLRFIQATDIRLTSARLALVCATQQVIASGLGILGVSAPLEMQ